jgi:predicted anti-sigma-YlaC factor YlaD
MSHPDSEVLAEHREGLISGRRGARITAHLAACDHCAALSDQLAEISVLLAAAPVPAMPDSVSHRLDMALAAEAAPKNGAERAGAEASGERAAHRRPARRHGWRLVTVRVLAPAAAVVVLAAVGLGLSHIGGPTNSSAASSAAAPPSASSSAAARAAAPVNSAESRPGAATALGLAHTFKVYNSPTSYQRSSLRDQIEHELRTPAGPEGAPSAQIKGCVNRVTGDSSLGTPVLVENARFQGQPAIVVVAALDGSDTVWVTAPGCSAASDTVLDTQSGISAP